MRTSMKWLAIFPVLCLSAWLSAASSVAQEKQPPGDRPRAEPRGEFDAESGPPREPRKPGGLKPRPKAAREDDRGDEQRPGRPDPFGEDQGPPARKVDPDSDPMGRPPLEGRQPPGDGRRRGPGQGPGPARGPGMPGMQPGMPFPPPLDPETEELNRNDAALERECAELASRLRRAAKDERENLKKQLTEAVNKHFDVRQKRRELQLKRLEEELQRLRETNRKRIEAREQLVNRRLAELMGPHDDLGF